MGMILIINIEEKSINHINNAFSGSGIWMSKPIALSWTPAQYCAGALISDLMEQQLTLLSVRARSMF